MWDEVEEEEVPTLPLGIVVNGASDKVKRLRTDGHRWKKSSNGGGGYGSDLVCRLLRVIQMRKQGVPIPSTIRCHKQNTIKKQGGVTLCSVCGGSMTFEKRPARRYIETGKKNTTVYH